jgi:hypothetical protein
VTDHVTLTQEHSKLYHYLSVFEGDAKRKLAMEQRRFDMLAPLLKALSKSSFEVLHKQVNKPGPVCQCNFCGCCGLHIARFVSCSTAPFTCAWLLYRAM